MMDFRILQKTTAELLDLQRRGISMDILDP
jgi:hypothetical protein